MTVTFPNTIPNAMPASGSSDRAGVVAFSDSLHAAACASNPAALTEALMPELADSFWLLVRSRAVQDATQQQVLRMVLERAQSQGVSVAFDVQWQPEHWGLDAESGPTPEVLRRCRPLIQAAALIRCTAAEAEAFFGSRDPAAIQSHLPQRPAVLVSDPAGVIRWSIGGHSGRLEPALVPDQGVFLAQMLENLCAHPQLLGTAGPGLEAIADPDQLARQLLEAAAASLGR